MGNLVNTLRQLIREEIALKEDRLGKGLVIADPEKVAKLKRLYPQDYWVVKIITTIEGATDRDITRLGYKDPSTGEFIDGLKQILNIKSERINSELRDLIKSGVIVDKAESAIPKKEKPEITGVKGRKASDTSKSKIVDVLINKFIENIEYIPTTQDITYTLQKSGGQTDVLTQDEINKIKSIAAKRSRRGEDPLTRRVNNTLSEEPLHEAYRRLQKLEPTLEKDKEYKNLSYREKQSLLNKLTNIYNEKNTKRRI